MQSDKWWLEWLKKNTEYSVGSLIITIDPRKEGYNAGLNNADIILTFNNKPATVPSLIDALNNLKPRESIALKVLKDGKKIKTIRLTRQEK